MRYFPDLDWGTDTVASIVSRWRDLVVPSRRSMIDTSVPVPKRGAVK